MKPLRLSVLLRRALTILLVMTVAPLGAAPLTVDLSAEAAVPARNDVIRATVFAQADGVNPAEVAARVNEATAAALKIAKRYASIKSQSGSVQTYPSVDKSGRIERWTVRAKIALESSNPVAMGELLGMLQAESGQTQAVIAVRDVSFAPSLETRRKAQAIAYEAAIAAFKADAGVIATALGKRYRISHLSFNGVRPVVPFARTAMAAGQAMPLPIEAGESQITVSLSGQIELDD